EVAVLDGTGQVTVLERGSHEVGDLGRDTAGMDEGLGAAGNAGAKRTHEHLPLARPAAAFAAELTRSGGKGPVRCPHGPDCLVPRLSWLAEGVSEAEGPAPVSQPGRRRCHRHDLEKGMTVTNELTPARNDARIPLETSGPLAWLLTRLSRRIYGKVLDPLRVASHHRPVLVTSLLLEAGAGRWKKLP